MKNRKVSEHVSDPCPLGSALREASWIWIKETKIRTKKPVPVPLEAVMWIRIGGCADPDPGSASAVIQIQMRILGEKIYMKVKKSLTL